MSIPVITNMLPAATALDLLDNGPYSLIDVRSEGEFAQGAIPGFVNLPILNDHERHEVGLLYKTAGQDAAIALGHALVDPYRAARVAAWAALTQPTPAATALMTCWRGGMRSQLAGEWLAASGVQALRVAGGYKAMRRELLAILNAPPPLVVVTALTGSGKTKLLQSLAPTCDVVDLEALAVHRGSTYGAHFGRPQPTQTWFENALAIDLRRCRKTVLVEDESLMIGMLRLPAAVNKGIRQSPVVIVDVPLAQRVQNLVVDYVVAPLQAGVGVAELEKALITATQRLVRRLGGALTSALVQQIAAAFASSVTQTTDPHGPAASGALAEAHAPWISTMLTDYYDKCYNHAATRDQRPCLYRGSYEDCRQWISTQYA